MLQISYAQRNFSTALSEKNVGMLPFPSRPRATGPNHLPASPPTHGRSPGGPAPTPETLPFTRTSHACAARHMHSCCAAVRAVSSLGWWSWFSGVVNVLFRYG